MAVALTTTLPAQPAGSGSVIWTALGGDGYTAPHAMYDYSLRITGDATGGNVVLSLLMDDRYVALVNWITLTISTATADVPSTLSITTAEGTGQGIADFAPCIWPDLGVGAARFWAPPPIVLANSGSYTPTIASTMANVNGAVFNQTGQIYLFRKRARETTPLYLMAQNLTR